MRDILTDIFRLVRLKAAVYFMHDFVSPWGISIPARPHVQFHIVLGGQAVIKEGDEEFAVSAGDVILFTKGAPHVISDGKCESPRAGKEVVPLIVGGEFPFGTDGAKTRIISGHFEFARGLEHFLFAGLPDVMHVAQTTHQNPQVFYALLSILADELQQKLPAGQMIIERLAEIAFAQTLRTHFAINPAPHFFRAVFNKQLAAALALIHERYSEPLRLEDLAASAGMSRSTFALRFKESTAISPIIYLSQWRMLQARELLSITDQSVGQVAFAVGHQSQEGFSRAFKQTFGTSPTQFRNNG